MLLKVAVAGTLIAALGSGSSLVTTRQTQTEERTNVVTANQSEESIAQAQQQREKLYFLQLRTKHHASRSSHSPTTVVRKKPHKAHPPKTVHKSTPRKHKALRVRSEAPSGGSNRRLGKALAAKRGWTGNQWTCLNNLWTRESGWRTKADNPNSSAYGIPQALPGSKMGSGWQTDPTVQINWGLKYIKSRYGTPCGAWSAFQRKGWY